MKFLLRSLTVLLIVAILGLWYRMSLVNSSAALLMVPTASTSSSTTGALSDSVSEETIPSSSPVHTPPLLHTTETAGREAVTQQPAPTVHVALISHGWKAAGYENNNTIKGRKRSVELTLKGLFRLQTTCPIHIHFVTGAEDEARIRSFLHTHVNKTAVQSYFSFTDLDEAQLEKWMKHIGHTASHRTGAAGNIKFFYPLFFPNVEKIIMLDTDVLIGRDICDMWRRFDGFKTDQLFSFAPQWPKYDAIKDNQLNAGVALLHLQRMRDANWLELSRASIANWEAKSMKPKCCAHGDQSVFHMIRYFRPDTLQLLPRWWNINKCHNYQNIHRNPKGSFVGIVHLGCCKMCTREKIGAKWTALLDAVDSWHPENDEAVNQFSFLEK